MTSISLSDVLLCALEACRLAGAIIREVRERGNLGVLEKGDGSDVIPDPQTEADRRAEALIVGALREYFPSLQIVGEEGALREASPDWDEVKGAFRPMEWTGLATGKVMQAGDVVIWVDPLDGTNDFINQRLECVTSLVGVSERGVPVGGVIYRPFSDEGLLGGEGLGVWHRSQGNMTEMRPALPAEGNIRRLVTSKTRESSRTDELIAKLGNFQVTKTGGAGWKFWKLLDSSADVYFYPKGGMKLWDICAGDALLRASGGCLTAPNGDFFIYDEILIVLHDGLIASSRSGEHKELITILNNDS